MSLDILRLSCELQSNLLKKLVDGEDEKSLLGSVAQQSIKELAADASSIYILTERSHRDGGHVAEMRAARGYQDYAIGAECRVVAPDEVLPQPSDDEKLGLTGWVISTGRSFLSSSPEELTKHPHWSGAYDAYQRVGRKTDDQPPPLKTAQEKLELTAFLGVPIRNPRGKIIGALKAERSEKDKEPFSVNNQIVLETFARVAGRCITYIEEKQNRRDNSAITAWARDIIAEAVAAEGELDDFLDIAVKAIAAATEADSCAVFLIDERNERRKVTLTQRAGSGSQELREVIRAYELPEISDESLQDCLKVEQCVPPSCCYRKDLPRDERGGVTAWVAATGKSFYASTLNELREHCHHLGRFDRPNFEDDWECGAWMGVPLLVGGNIIGVLKIENTEEVGNPSQRVFSYEVQQRLNVLAQDLALAVRRLEQQSPARYQVIQKAMSTIYTILQGGREDIDKLVEGVVQDTAALFDARACALFLKEGRQLIQPSWAAHGWAKSDDVRRYQLVDKKDIVDEPQTDAEKVGLTVWIAVKRAKFTAKSHLELTLHPHHKGTYDDENFKAGERCETFMGVPLLWGEGDDKEKKELVGVLKVETKMKGGENNKEFAYFNEQDELVFELIANSVVIAIQNARLVQARRLAEEILNLDANRVMDKLCRFVQNRVEVVNTLNKAVAEVRPQSAEKAVIIQSFASLLEQGFRIDILDQLADSMADTMQLFLRFLAQAIQTDRIEKIIALDRAKPPVAALTDAHFVLKDCAGFFLDTLGDISNPLKEYLQHPERRQILTERIKALEERNEQIENMNPFERSVLRRVIERWLAIVTEESLRFHKITNPYVAGQPLRQENSEVFIGRENIFQWINANLQNPNNKKVLILHGGWHTGKTSILYQLKSGPMGRAMRERPRHPIIPVFIDLQAILSPGAHILLWEMATQIHKSLQEFGIAIPQPSRDMLNKELSDTIFNAFLAEVDQTLHQRSEGLLVIMLDEFELLDERVKKGEIQPSIFQYLRSKMQHQTSVTFILAGRRKLDEMTLEYRNLIYNVSSHREVGFLNKDEAERLIRKPVEMMGVTYTPSVVERILNLTGGHPFFIQQLCSNCIDILNEEERGYEVTDVTLSAALETALKHNTVLEYLWKKESTENDQMVLKSLAWLSGDGRRWVSKSQLLTDMQALDDPQLSSVLQKLEAQKLVESQSQDSAPTHYRYQVDLLRLWIIHKLV